MKKRKTKPNKSNSKSGSVCLVGAGPGDPGLLTLRGAEAIASADVLIYDLLVNEVLLELNERAEKIYVGKNVKEKIKSSLKGRKCGYVEQSKINSLLVRYAKAGKKVVRLKGGDPFVFGRGGEETSFLKKKNIRFEVVPGISSGIAAPSYAGIPVTDRRYSSSVTFITCHEKSEKLDAKLNWKSLARMEGTLVVFMGLRNLSKMVTSLMNAGRLASTRISIIEKGTLAEQRVVEGTLRDIVKKVKANKIDSPALAVIGKVNRLRKDLAWFEKKPLYGKNVVVTRARSQASRLKKILEDRGAKVLEYPTIQILPPRNTAPLDKAITDICDFDWVVFTSVNGVEGFFNRLSAQKKDTRSLFSVKVAAIGDATREALEQKGIRVDLMPDKFTSEALIKTMRDKIKIKGTKILLPRTDIAPDYMKTEIEKYGGNVTEVVAYRTVPAKNVNKQAVESIKKSDYVLFTSSSTVRNFFEKLPKNLHSKLRQRAISIGPITSQTLKGYGIKPFKEAKDHTVAGLVEVLNHV